MKNYRFCSFLFLASSCLFAQSAAPQVPDTLDLPTALRFALDNNFAIRQAR
jgi:hypothetical protein